MARERSPLRDEVNEMVSLFASGSTYEVLAGKYGVTRQRICQLINEDVEASKKVKEIRELRRAQKKEALEQQRLTNLETRTCIVCTKEFSCAKTKHLRTCGPLCSSLWTRYRWAFDLEAYKYVRSLQKGLNDVPNRQYLYSNSQLLTDLSIVMGSVEAAKERLLSVRRPLMES